VIETAILELIPCGLEHFEAILEDQKQVEQMLGVTVFDNWFDFPGVVSIRQTSPETSRRMCAVSSAGKVSTDRRR
jgi:hypothetical protein